jgi:hypothetical protein
MGLTLLAWAWFRSARAALAGLAGGDAWYAQKLQSATFGVQWLLPEAQWRWQRVARREAVLPALV